MSAIVVRLADGRQFRAATTEVLAAWAKQGRIPPDAMIEEDGAPPVAASLHPALAGLVPGAPPVHRGTAPAPVKDDAVSVVIPYRNGPALAGYYVSVGSLIPVLGLVLGPLAIGLGVAGFRKVRRDPKCHGTAHAIVAIVLGALTTILYWGLLVMMLVAMP